MYYRNLDELLTAEDILTKDEKSLDQICCYGSHRSEQLPKTRPEAEHFRKTDPSATIWTSPVLVQSISSLLSWTTEVVCPYFLPGTTSTDVPELLHLVQGARLVLRPQ